jgi:type VI secretion system secreted protein Hcp
MAVDAFLSFAAPKTGPKLIGETTDSVFSKQQAFEIKEFSFGEENPTTIGSATSGAGAGKAKLNPFKIKKPVDSASPNFFLASASGVHYPTATLSVRKAGAAGGKSSGAPYLIFTFKLVYVTNVDWTGPGDEEGPEEEITFVYGALQISYSKQGADGAIGTPNISAWSQVLNQANFDVPG